MKKLNIVIIKKQKKFRQATLKSQPANTVNGKIRITDQGEVIQQKYGYKPLAEYNL